MFGKGKKEKDIQKVLEGLTPEEKQDLLESLKTDESNEQKGNETNVDSTNGADVKPTNESEKVIILKVVVDPSDLGKVIGKGGKIASSIRTIVKSASAKSGRRFIVKIS